MDATFRAWRWISENKKNHKKRANSEHPMKLVLVLSCHGSIKWRDRGKRERSEGREVCETKAQKRGNKYRVDSQHVSPRRCLSSPLCFSSGIILPLKVIVVN